MLFTILYIYLGLTSASLVTSVLTNIYIDKTYTRPGMGTDGFFIPRLNKWSTDVTGFLLMPVYIPYKILHYVYYNLDKILEAIANGIERFGVWLGHRLWDLCLGLKWIWLNVIEPGFRWIGARLLDLLEFLWNQVLIKIFNGIKTIIQYISDAISFIWTNVFVKCYQAFCDILNYIWTNIIVRTFRILCNGLEKLLNWLVDVLAGFFKFVAQIFKDYIYPGLKYFFTKLYEFLEYFFTQLWEGIKYLWFNILVPVFQTIGDWIYRLCTWLSQKWEEFLNFLGNILKFIWDNIIVKGFNLFCDFMKYLNDKFVDFLVWLANSIYDLAIFLWNNVFVQIWRAMEFIWTNVIVELFWALGRAIHKTSIQVLNWLRWGWRFLMDWIVYPGWEMVKSVGGHLSNFMYQIYLVIYQVCREAWNALTMTMTTIWNSLTFTMSKIWDSITLSMTVVYNSLSVTMNNIWNQWTGGR